MISSICTGLLRPPLSISRRSGQYKASSSLESWWEHHRKTAQIEAIKMTDLYAKVDTAALKADAEECMLSFGSAFHKDIITRAKDGYIYTSEGHRMLDWTSGQMVRCAQLLPSL